MYVCTYVFIYLKIYIHTLCIYKYIHIVYIYIYTVYIYIHIIYIWAINYDKSLNYMAVNQLVQASFAGRTEAWRGIELLTSAPTRSICAKDHLPEGGRS
jgi:hypothetical protein